MRLRGLMLPTEDTQYTNEEVSEIAKRQREILDEMERLDNRLVEIAGREPLTGR
jgi:hypothetical protein